MDMILEGGYFKIAENGARRVYRDLGGVNKTYQGSQFFPEDYSPPLVLQLRGLERSLALDSGQAEALYNKLPVVEPAAPIETFEDDQSEYFTKAPIWLLPMPVVDAFSPEEWRRVVNLRTSSGEVVAEVEKSFLPPEGARRASAIAVFNMSDTEVLHRLRLSAAGNEVQLGQALIDVMQLLIYDAEQMRVEQVWPPRSAPGHEGARAVDVEPDPAVHQEIMDTVCGGQAKRFTETRIVDGELREVDSFGCERCPSEFGYRPGDMRFEFIAQGSFSSAGAEEALVHSAGCGRRENTLDGVMSYLRRDLQGRWQLVTHDSYRLSDCEFFETEIGRSLPVCYERFIEDPVPARLRAITIRGDEIAAHQLFLWSTNILFCEPGYAIVGIKEMEVKKRKDGQEELAFVVKTTVGQSLNGEPHCWVDDEQMRVETDRLEFGLLITHSGLEETPEATAALEKIRGLL